jgi:SAM-dependent methyltransferase
MKLLKIPMRDLKKMRKDLDHRGISEQGTLIAYTHPNPLIRWIFWKRLEMMLKGIKPLERVLDYGCGTGALLYSLSKYCGEVYGLDAEIRPAELMKKTFNLKKVSLIKQSALKLPFKNESLDAIFAADVLEHFSEENVERIHKEFSRVLKKNGLLVISGPTENFIYRLTKKVLFRKKQANYDLENNSYTIEHHNNINNVLDVTRKTMKIERVRILPTPLIPGFKIAVAKKI